jgi:hypothetical protein
MEFTVLSYDGGQIIVHIHLRRGKVILNLDLCAPHGNMILALPAVHDAQDVSNCSCCY